MITITVNGVDVDRLKFNYDSYDASSYESFMKSAETEIYTFITTVVAGMTDSIRRLDLKGAPDSDVIMNTLLDAANVNPDDIEYAMDEMGIRR